MAGEPALFENLNFAKNVIVMTDATATGLLAQIQQIRLPTKILSIYFDGKLHTAWLATTARVRQLPQPNKFQTKEN